MRLASFAGAALLLAGCNSKGVVQLVLGHDQTLEDPSVQVQRMEVVVSSPQGLAGVTAPGKRPGGGEARDWDGDGKLELVFSFEHTAGRPLPILEVGMGDDEDRLLEFRVAGYADASSTRPIAYGGTTLSPIPGAVNKLGVAFNLRPEARSPQVVLVLPPDGTQNVPGNLAAVTLAFSTTLDPTTLAGATLAGPDGGVAFDAKIDTVTLNKGSPLEEQRSILNLRLPALAEGHYQVQVGPPLASSSGRVFDPTPFTSSFDVQWGIGVPPVCSCSEGYLCQTDAGGGWACAFAPTCAQGCLGLTVCDPSGPQCVEDCREAGSCPLACDSASGLCR